MEKNRRYTIRALLLMILTLSLSLALVRIGLYSDSPFSSLLGIAGLTLLGGTASYVFGFLVGGKMSARQAAFFAIFWLLIIFIGLGLSAMLDLVF